MNQDELLQQVQAVSAQLTKISGETSGLLALVTTLRDEIANAGNVSPEVEAAMANLMAKATAIDALVPDAETPPEGGGETPAP